MIFLVNIHRINFINVDIEDKNHNFIVSRIPENDIDNLYQYFSGFRVENNIIDDAYWHYKTGLETILETEKFYNNRFSHWKYFVFDIPDNILDEETALYFKLKYGS